MIIPVSIIILVKDVSELGCKLWMQQRSENGPLNGLLEFPGGKIEDGELPISACKRELKEESQIDITHLEQFKIVSYEYKDRSVCLFVHFANGQELVPLNGDWFDFTFKSKSLAYKDRLPAVNYEIIDDLLDYLKKHLDAGFLEKIWVQK
ncbi:NUDIX domain-containing protein [Halobacteriovorax sp. HLS]|uniref:NUDIX domain-containing protein n=1 Tax=Halobacteriovorax sp. HLS TaxID=2234000 RepID=UPI000FDA0963|nr:NUDIX domain-containing protein [Halobacteriovorax sp. HLS]